MPPRSQSDDGYVPVPLKPTSTNITNLSSGGKPNSDSSEVSSPPTSKDNVKETVTVDKNLNVNALLPWYRRGGMHVNMVGMAFNITLPVIILLQTSNLSTECIKYYTTIWGLSILLSVLPPCNMRTTYCIAVMPTFLTSLLLSLTLTLSNDNEHSNNDYDWLEILKSAIAALTCSLAISILKVNICMSVCLHRYAAHHAFKCYSDVTSLAVQLLGCLANQGGAIWWASQHRCHHKYCDLDNDPHSPILMGIENAFGFFDIYQGVNEMFTPRHLNGFGSVNRILDTWSFIMVSLELYISYTYFGRYGLFISYTSGWSCQSITLWFNIVNHPPNNKINALVTLSSSTSAPTSIKESCLASDGTPTTILNGVYYLPFHLLNVLHPLYGLFVMESEHKHHHDHAKLAKRSWYDIAYWGFVKPLEIAGFIYDVQV